MGIKGKKRIFHNFSPLETKSQEAGKNIGIMIGKPDSLKIIPSTKL